MASPPPSQQEDRQDVGTVPEEGYQRGLGARQVQMIAISGAIGTGLFYGSGDDIAKIGPSLIACYAIGGVVVFFIMRALGELLLHHPTSGSFADYAHEYFGPFAGYFTGWSYWALWVTSCMAEVTAAGAYINFWWPAVPTWLTAAVALGVLFVSNLVSVKVYGELEFWFSVIKVVAIVAMIVIGVGVLTVGFSALGDSASVTHLWRDGGFAPKGVWESLLAMQGVIFAYNGIEVIALTAGEAQNPRKNLRRAVNTLPVRIGIFYVGSLVVLLSVLSWTHFAAGASPFVKVFTLVGIPGAAGIMNFVVLTAALSSCNSGIYATGRMLRGLALSDQAPRAMARLNRRRVPFPALALSGVAMALGVIVNVVSPGKAFLYVTSVSTCATLWTWGLVLVAHLRHRARVRAGRAEPTGFPMPGAPYTNWISLAALAFVVVVMATDADTRIALYVWAVWSVLLVVGYLIIKRTPGGERL